MREINDLPALLGLLRNTPAMLSKQAIQLPAAVIGKADKVMTRA